MLRIKTTALVCQDNKFFFYDELFSGLGFHIVNGVVEKVTEYLNGLEIRDYRSEYIDYNDNRICIDSSFLKGGHIGENDDYGPAFYNKKRFSGIAYEFENDECLAEYLFENGFDKIEVCFFRDGDLESYEDFRNQMNQSFYWHYNGKLKGISLSSEEFNLRVEFNFDDQERIRTAMIQGNYFESVSKLSPQLKYHLFETKAYAKQLFAAPYLYLRGDGVDDEFFNNLQSSEGFKSLAKICIDKTSLTSRCIANLKWESNLKEILIEDEKQDLLEIIKELKNERPDCLVKLIL
jgi:hypothetical protein